ncbi:MAG: IRE (iron responsive element), partial [Planctomycetaceae bacterium]
MSKLTALQRKLVYTGCILLLLIPITFLGLPSEPGQDGRVKPGTGGILAQMRQDYELGEASLGNVDPTSSTMNLLLLGFRGFATSRLWMNAQEQQKHKDWASLDATVKSIALLQPHFQKVWHFQGWNLAYNVSAEWDAVADRYYWVKRGIAFYKEGKDRNEKFPELYWYTGDTLGKKIGRADEWKEFRNFFINDPDLEQYPDGWDRELNPDRQDNYLVARTWFQEANNVIDRYNNQQR